MYIAKTKPSNKTAKNYLEIYILISLKNPIKLFTRICTLIVIYQNCFPSKK